MFKAQVIGNIGADPQMKYSQGGTAMLQFSVASNGRTRDQSGEWQDRTEWVRCTVFGSRADALNQHLRKGMRVYVEGRLEARPWTGQNGQLNAGLELVANDVEFFSPRQEGEGGQERTARQPVASGSGRPMPYDGDLPF